jgi:magnesium chelatase subunit I
MSSKTIDEFVHRSYVSKPKYFEIMPGVPEDYSQIKTLGDLLAINYKHITVERQLRGNLIRKLKSHEFPYPGIIGYNEDVIPAVNRAILAWHDILFVGQIGQAKTKIAECIAESLLSLIPVVQGSITNDIPTSIPENQMINILNDVEVVRTSPEFTVSKECEEIIRNNKMDTKINWIEGSRRYRYILATPDISVKDLVGQIDAIKIAKKGVELYDIESYSSGQLLQARHGILCIDELPVLDPRKQVALLSVLQEGKFTTGSYPVVFKPDVRIMATANPVDYTHSGKIIEPLFDRLRSHVNTHYPRTTLDEMLIIIQEARIADEGNVFLPVFMLRTVAKIMELARTHRDINQDKGVSVRVAIHSMELLVGEAERTRSISQFVKAIPRFCDIHSIHQSVKFELTEIEDSLETRINVLNSIIDNAIRQVSLEYIQKLSLEKLAKLKNEFTRDKTFLVSQVTLGSTKSHSLTYETQLELFPELRQVVEETILVIDNEQKKFAEIAKSLGIRSKTVRIGEEMNGEFTAAVTEVILEGLRWGEPPLLDRKDGSYGAIQ